MRPITWVLIAIVGLGTGVLGTIVVSRGRRADRGVRPPMPERIFAPDDDSAPVRGVGASGSARRAALPLALDLPPTIGATPPGIPSVDEQRQMSDRLKKEYQERLREHQRQAVDPRLVKTMAPLMQTALDKLTAKLKANRASHDCRTTTCVATVEVPSLIEARNNLMEVPIAFMDVPCSQEVMVSDPAEKGGPEASGILSVMLTCNRHASR